MSNPVYFYDKEGKILAILIKKDCRTDGIMFLTEENNSQQVAVMGHNRGHIIQAHYHNKVLRSIYDTVETLIIRQGILEVSLYDDKTICSQFSIGIGDILTLFSGGHGFKVIEDVDMVEIKQGPFLGDNDKVRF